MTYSAALCDICSTWVRVGGAQTSWLDQTCCLLQISLQPNPLLDSLSLAFSFFFFTIFPTKEFGPKPPCVGSGGGKSQGKGGVPNSSLHKVAAKVFEFCLCLKKNPSAPNPDHSKQCAAHGPTIRPKHHANFYS